MSDLDKIRKYAQNLSGSNATGGKDALSRIKKHAQNLSTNNQDSIQRGAVTTGTNVFNVQAYRDASPKAQAAIVKPTTGPTFNEFRKQNAVKNASSGLFKMDNTLMGQAVSNANAVTQQIQQQRSDEIQKKLAEAQQQRAQDLQAKITELQHQQDIYFDANREAELEKAKRDYANVEETLQKTSLAADTVGKGAGMFNQGAANFADFVSNAIPRVEGWLMGVEPEETFTGQLL